ncbi:MAG: hypothetical protein L0Y60_04380 [Beijerinckiaceae bacterium]|nr:hypothetical protein [Beijerinckiaceae bacterium]
MSSDSIQLPEITVYIRPPGAIQDASLNQDPDIRQQYYYPLRNRLGPMRNLKLPDYPISSDSYAFRAMQGRDFSDLNRLRAFVNELFLESYAAARRNRNSNETHKRFQNELDTLRNYEQQQNALDAAAIDFIYRGLPFSRQEPEPDFPDLPDPPPPSIDDLPEFDVPFNYEYYPSPW